MKEAQKREYLEVPHRTTIPCLDHAYGSASEHSFSGPRNTFQNGVIDTYLCLLSAVKGKEKSPCYFMVQAKTPCPLEDSGVPLQRYSTNTSNREIFMHALIILGSWPFVLGHSTLMPDRIRLCTQQGREILARIAACLRHRALNT